MKRSKEIRLNRNLVKALTSVLRMWGLSERADNLDLRLEEEIKGVLPQYQARWLVYKHISMNKKTEQLRLL